MFVVFCIILIYCLLLFTGVLNYVPATEATISEPEQQQAVLWG